MAYTLLVQMPGFARPCPRPCPFSAFNLLAVFSFRGFEYPWHRPHSASCTAFSTVACQLEMLSTAASGRLSKHCKADSGTVGMALPILSKARAHSFPHSQVHLTRTVRDAAVEQDSPHLLRQEHPARSNCNSSACRLPHRPRG